MDTLGRILPKPVKDILRPIYHFIISAAKFIIQIFFKTLSALLGKKRFLSMVHFFSGELDTSIEVEGIKFTGEYPIPFFRAVSIMTKEPDTIAWIDDFIEEDDVLYDVGANIGVFSLYAAVKRNARAIAFEPLASNYSVLNENIYLNGLSERITALNIAMHDKNMLSHFNVSELLPGKAGHSFENPVGSRDEIFKPSFLQGMIGMRMDEFVETYQTPFPNHVKIDVDANEPMVIDGMRGLMSDPRLKSIAVELNTDLTRHTDLIDKIKGFGFEMLEGDRYINHDYLSQGPMLNHYFVRS